MLSTYTFYLTLLAVLSSPAMAAPIDTLSSIQCHCLTFYTYSPPATCTLPHSQNLSWNAAQSFASANKLDITFASQAAVSRVLEVERPLPTSVLMSLYGGLARGSGRSEVGSRVVCGSWDEVTKKYVTEVQEVDAAASSITKGDFKSRKCDGLISEVVGMLVLFLVLYAVGEYVWARTFPSQGQIQLDGDEKDLLAFAESGAVCTPEVDEKRPTCEPAAHTTAS
ncbi:hypothetical protein DM02DRAFT_623100 [Periconia macrospinosa]|uniref:Uncharacterized protein n=1 Tax=Periconia macrospinosa TaxID=97972 RepID=A0A2V1E7P2_9PLEO|nr:hypothetical protein DM02DRAFT_623100 [Periconia macrospinosa]